MEGKTIEELAKKNVSLRFYTIDKDDVLDGDYAMEVCTEDRVSLSFIQHLKRRLPLEYDKVVIDNYGDETIIEFIGTEEEEG